MEIEQTLQDVQDILREALGTCPSARFVILLMRDDEEGRMHIAGVNADQEDITHMLAASHLAFGGMLAHIPIHTPTQ